MEGLVLWSFFLFCPKWSELVASWNYVFSCTEFAELFIKITPPIIKIDCRTKNFPKTFACNLSHSIKVIEVFDSLLYEKPFSHLFHRFNVTFYMFLSIWFCRNKEKITHMWRRWGTPQSFFLGFINELEKQIIIKKTVEVGQ